MGEWATVVSAFELIFADWRPEVVDRLDRIGRDLFDRELVESQEALEMKVIGQFRDVDDPDRFV